VIPHELVERLKDQAEFNPLVFRSPANQAEVRDALEELGIGLDQEIARFLLAYRMHAIRPVRNSRQLNDICEPRREIFRSTEFARSLYGLNDDFVCLDTAEGEGYIVYSKTTRAIYEGGIPEVPALNAGTLAPTYRGFFEFMLDYVLPGFVPDTGSGR